MISFIISINYKSSRTKLHKKKYRRYAGLCTILFLVMMGTFFISYSSLTTSQTVNVSVADTAYRTVHDSVFIKGLYLHLK